MVFTKRNTLLVISSLIGIFLTVFIFIQSLLNAEASSEQSRMVVDLLTKIINGIAPNTIDASNIDAFSNLIRKLVGHFLLFSLCGFFNTWSLLLTMEMRRKLPIYGIVFSVILGLAVAIISESLQLLAQGRSGEMTDVLIDICGYAVGLIIIYIAVILVYRSIRKRNANSGEEVY